MIYIIFNDSYFSFESPLHTIEFTTTDKQKAIEFLDNLEKTIISLPYDGSLVNRYTLIEYKEGTNIENIIKEISTKIM